LNNLYDIAARTKHPAFREEKEWRLVAYSDGNDPKPKLKFRPTLKGVVSYVEIHLVADRKDERALVELDGIVVGPTQDRDVAIPAIRLLLKEHGYHPDLVRPSEAPFRD
jgi:hypothetical protein